MCPECSIRPPSPQTLKWPLQGVLTKMSPPCTSLCPCEDIWVSTGCYTKYTHTHTLLRGRKLAVELMFACWDLIRFVLLRCDLISWCTLTHIYCITAPLPTLSLSYLKAVSLSLPLPVSLPIGQLFYCRDNHLLWEGKVNHLLFLTLILPDRDTHTHKHERVFHPTFQSQRWHRWPVQLESSRLICFTQMIGNSTCTLKEKMVAA